MRTLAPAEIEREEKLEAQKKAYMKRLEQEMLNTLGAV